MGTAGEPPLPLSHAGMQQGLPEGAAQDSLEASRAAVPHANGAEEPPGPVSAAPAAAGDQDVAGLQERVRMLEKDLLDSENTHRLR